MSEDTRLIQANVDSDMHAKLRVIAFRAGGCSNAELLRIVLKDFVRKFEEKHGPINADQTVSLT